MPIKSINGTSFEVTPWTSGELNLKTKFKVEMIHIFEEIGGNIANGDIIMSYIGKSDGSTLKELLGVNKGTIKLRDNNAESRGTLYDIPFYVVSRSISGNRITMHVNCVDSRKFTDRISSTSFKNTESAIKCLYPGAVNINVSPDSFVNSHEVFQFCETDQSLCSKLCLAYRHNTTFSYSFKGLQIKDLTLNNRTTNNSYYLGERFETSSVLNYFQNPILDHTPLDSWTDIREENTTFGYYSGVQPVNCTAVTYMDSTYTVGKDYSVDMNNYLFNKRLIDNMYASTIVVGYGVLPTYTPGDIIFVDSSLEGGPEEFTRYIVRSNEIYYAAEDNEFFLDGKKFVFTTKLINPKEGSWVSSIY